MSRLARRLVKDSADAEDVVQDAFVNILGKLDTFEARASLSTWMHRIVVNQALMLLRKRKRMREAPIDDLLPEFGGNGCRLEPMRSELDSPETSAQRTETGTHVRKLIDRLPDNYRIVLMLRDIEELSVTEVADLLEISQANVKVRLHRARAALKKLLEPTFRDQLP